METLLKFNPAKRLTAHAALRHPYVARYKKLPCPAHSSPVSQHYLTLSCRRFHNTSNEPEMKHDVIPPLSDCVQLSVEQYRAKLYDIIRSEKAKKAEVRSTFLLPNFLFPFSLNC